MRPQVKTYLVDEAGERAFGPGPAELLRRVREQGSLRAAALSMGMAYTKALSLVRRAEEALGHPLTHRVVGGAGGGGSTPTPEAEALLAAYERWSAEVERSAAGLYASAFDGVFGTSECAGEARVAGEGVALRDAARSSAGGVAQGACDCTAPGLSPNGVAAPGEAPASSRVGVAMLAAGHARRFGANKLLAELAGAPVMTHTLGCVPAGMPLAACACEPEVRALARAAGAALVEPDTPEQSGSVVALARYAQQEGWDACIFVPADQPLIRRESLRAMVLAWNARPKACVRLGWHGRHSSPVLFPAAYYSELMALTGDAGGASVAAQATAQLAVEAVCPWELWDIDTPSELERVRDIMEAGFAPVR